MQTEKYAEVEKLVHKTIDRLTDLRIRQNREFFNIAPSEALDILKDIASTIDDAVVNEYVDGEPIQCYPKQEVVIQKNIQKSPQKPPFKFSMIDLKIGDVITFIPTGVEVTIASDCKVEYQGRLWSLSAFTGTFLPEEKRTKSGAYQGPKFFSYEGKSLKDIRDEKEKQ